MKIYLACKYAGTEDVSFIAANKIAAELMQACNIVFSPISMSHPIAQQCELPANWDFWEKNDAAFIDWCDQVYVICLPGWEKSVGVQAEIKMALEKNKPVKYIELSGGEI